MSVQKTHIHEDGTKSMAVMDELLNEKASAIQTLVGDLSDEAWDGTGNPESLIALLKRIEINTAQIGGLL